MKRFLAILVFAGLIFASGCKKDEKKAVHKKGKVSVQEWGAAKDVPSAPGSNPATWQPEKPLPKLIASGSVPPRLHSVGGGGCTIQQLPQYKTPASCRKAEGKWKEGKCINYLCL